MEFNELRATKSSGIFKDAIIFIILFCIVLFVFVFVMNYVITPVVVENVSMEPTLHQGDRRFVLITKKIKAGDIVVFKYEDNEEEGEIQLVKRVVAIEGEYVYKEGECIYVRDNNGVVRLAYKDFNDTLTPTAVPKGFFYAMGDNINISKDSTEFGCVSLAKVLGKLL